jgi:TetR/AcrR family transcriptional regulator, cholesterol catabolism regulator
MLFRARRRRQCRGTGTEPAEGRELTTKQRDETQPSIKRGWILDKAGSLFWQKGYYTTSMRDIAAACRCKPANIYNYFDSKEDILFEVIRDITQRAVTSIEDLRDDELSSPVEQMKALVTRHFHLLAGIKRSNVLISDTGLKDLSTEHRKVIIKLRDEYDLIMERVIERGIKAGLFLVKDTKVAIYLISSVIVRSSLWFSPKGRLSDDEVGELMFDFVYRAIKA